MIHDEDQITKKSIIMIKWDRELLKINNVDKMGQEVVDTDNSSCI